jgi:cyclopropane-fatty-acyl-phospholipid synthase
VRARGATWIDRWCRQRVFDRLAHLRAGTISLVEPDASYPFGARVDDLASDAELYVRQPSFYRHVVAGGGLGAAEAYMAGEWSADDLPGLLQLFARDASACAEIDRSWARRLRLPVERSLAWLRRNTMTGSRKNIAAHYDLSNDFYRLWLDESMAYSSAVFPNEASTLAEAQGHKFDLACQKLQLKPGDRLLEIGTGWGGLAMHAATNYGCHVTTTTISDQQHDYAKEQIALRGLTNRITLLNRDYRQLTGQFDKLVSIEMIEAVGHEYLPTFFRACSDRLRPGGLMVLQAITIPATRSILFSDTFSPVGRSPHSARCTALSLTGLGYRSLVLTTTQRTTPARWRRGARGSLTSCTKSGGLGSTSSSFACGTTICRTASPVSASGKSVWFRWNS